MFKKLLLITFLGVVLNEALTPSTTNQKIHVSLLETLINDGKANVVISFNEETRHILDSVNRIRFDSRGHKITFLKTQLEQLTKDSQRSVISILKSHSTTFQSFWINNRIIVKNASIELIQQIAQIADVSEIREELVIRHQPPIPTRTKQEEGGWGVVKIEADQAWNLVGGNNGYGVVVASMGTGVRYTHEAIRGNYRSSYGWFDPYTRTRNPIDVHGHGTNALGLVTGINGIGVAPGAQWISCRGCDDPGDGSITCTEAAVTSCGEWVLCPTLWNTQQPDCSQAPNIVSGSWNEGGRGNDFYADVVDAWKVANIIPIFPVGDFGTAGCFSVHSPGDYEGVIGVGATAQSDAIVPSSSRGPTLDGRIKPDVAAPALNIRTICKESDTAYCNAAGTGMAVPHVAGTVAMLLARDPELTFDQIKDLLQNNADRELGETESCGGTNSTQDWPNNVYGYGRINARRALTALINDSL
ncbi:Bacillopeptidase F [Orchesella cincta]|uniref:Bacillopeptidase F n=1 Tax=Orchesella cincta TaxID=48709 RepID=A0A1D2MGD6_ORCCI|nr:Bacillopeptidase F [Orchesella cincta]